MAKLFGKSPLVDTNPDEPAIDARMRQLEARRIADTMEIIALEKTGATLEPPDPKRSVVDARVAELLGDDRPKQPNSKNLADLYADREAIDQALVIAGQRSLAAHGEIVTRRCAERLPEWIDLTRRRAIALATLRRLNAEADQFLADLSSGGQRGGMPAAFPGVRLLGSGNVGVDALRYFEGAIRAGYITQKEIDNA